MTDARAPPIPATPVYEVREHVDGALLPAHDYGVTGQCATGSGLAPASIYAQGQSGRGAGLGAGLGVRAGILMAVSPPTPGQTSWWGVRLVGGLDLGLLYARVDTGLGDVSGQLCARLENDGVSVQYRGSTVLLGQLSTAIGAHLGLGDGSQSDAWHGVVLGAAIVPTLTYLQPWVADGTVDGSFLGFELSLDFATVQYGTAQMSGKRVSLFLLFPPEDKGPMVAQLSFGIVWGGALSAPR
jgi:hypothetical protein